MRANCPRKEGKLYAFFVDFKTAFDNVDRRKLWEELVRIQIPGHLIRAIQNLYSKTVYIINDVKFKSYKGLKQGCPLSPLLFALYVAGLDRALKANISGGIILRKKKIHCLAFADDMVLL